MLRAFGADDSKIKQCLKSSAPAHSALPTLAIDRSTSSSGNAAPLSSSKPSRKIFSDASGAPDPGVESDEPCFVVDRQSK